MSTFRRSGHWRTGVHGTLHWVSAHTVSRDQWDSPGGFLTIPLGPIRSPERYASYVIPNARCPVCDASVFYYQSPYGGRVFFDQLGPPWPKHGCTDNGRPVACVTEGKYIQSWAADGWAPISVEEIEWGRTSAIVRSIIHTIHGSHQLAFSASVADAELLGPLASVKWLEGKAGIASTPGADGMSPVEFTIKRVSHTAKIAASRQQALDKADARLFYKTMAVDLIHATPLKSEKFNGALTGFRDGKPVLAVYMNSETFDVMQFEDFAWEWMAELVKAPGNSTFSAAARNWDRLLPPVVIVGFRRRADGREFTVDLDGVDVEACAVSSVGNRVELIRRTAGTTLDGQLRVFADPDSHGSSAFTMTLPVIRQVAHLRGVEHLLEPFIAAVKAQQFVLDFRHSDGCILFVRSDAPENGDRLDLWLPYACPRRGLLVTLSTTADSPLRRTIKRAWPGTKGPDEPGHALSDAPKEGRISRWLGTASEIADFATRLKAKARSR